MMTKNYEITDETIQHRGHTLHRIRALQDIPAHGVKAGDLGGFIESETNLSQNLGSWVADDAKVYGNAQVLDFSLVRENAEVCDDAIITRAASVGHYARVYGGTNLTGPVDIDFHAEIRSNGDILFFRPAVCGAPHTFRMIDPEFDFFIYRCLHEPMVSMIDFMGSVPDFIKFVETAPQFKEAILRDTILAMIRANQPIIDDWGPDK